VLEYVNRRASPCNDGDKEMDNGLGVALLLKKESLEVLGLPNNSPLLELLESNRSRSSSLEEHTKIDWIVEHSSFLFHHES